MVHTETQSWAQEGLAPLTNRGWCWPGVSGESLITAAQDFRVWFVNIPRQNSQNQVKDKEGADDYERDEVEPVPGGAQSIVGL